MRVYGLVQSQIGSGHFIRMKQIQKGLITKGHSINLQHIEGKISHEEMKRRMVGQMELISDYLPDILLLEGFPFMRYAWMATDFPGKPETRFEWYEKHGAILELIRIAKNKGIKIVTSLRDISIPHSEARSILILEWINKYIDLILVHGDESFIKLEDSFPYIDLIDVPIHYTGYVADLYKPSSKSSRHGVLVSGASGSVADLVFDEALNLYKRSNYKEPWTFIISDKHPIESIKKFKEYAKGEKDIKIVSNITTREFRKLLTKSRLSISQCGYNTFLDSHITETPTTFIPFTDNGATGADQPMRTKFYGNGNININLNGVKNTVEILETFVHNEDMEEMAKCC